MVASVMWGQPTFLLPFPSILLFDANNAILGQRGYAQIRPQAIDLLIPLP